jgi:hypothetical protein
VPAAFGGDVAVPWLSPAPKVGAVAEPAAGGATLQIEGWGVASLELERRWTSYGDSIPDRVFLFRASGSWSLLVIRLTDRDGAEGRVGRATVSVRRFGSTDEIRGHIEQTYAADAWYDLTQAGRHEPELFLPWLAERTVRDFDRASVVDKALALSPGPGGELLPGPGRGLKEWRRNALNAISARLAELGLKAVNLAVVPPSVPASEREVGEVLVRRHGFETTGVVRVDPAGEVYVRLPDEATFLPVEESER